jgi:hypothetical protein
MGDVPALMVRDFGGVRVDTTDSPILLMEFPEHRLQDADFHAALESIEKLMRECRGQRDRCAQITDLTRMHEIAPASQRKCAGEWLKRNNELVLASSVGGATVTPSAILRGLVTAVHWFHKPDTGNDFFATRAEAQRHVIQRLEQARVSLPPRVCELRERLLLQLHPPREKQPSGLTWRR